MKASKDYLHIATSEKVCSRCKGPRETEYFYCRSCAAAVKRANYIRNRPLKKDRHIADLQFEIGRLKREVAGLRNENIDLIQNFRGRYGKVGGLSE
jgi:hypothetical protein